jgi:hypothetical protein
MNKLFRIVPLAALMLAGAAQTMLAQTQTDEVLVLNIQLNAVSQGPTTTNRAGVVTTSVKVHRITSQDVIQVLGAATGNTFSSNAQLVLLTPTNDLDAWTVQIRDGNNQLDVSGFIAHQPGTTEVGSSSFNPRTGNASGADYGVDSFSLQDQGGFPPLSEHFSVSGLTITSSRGVVRQGQVVGQVDRVDAQVSGTGDRNGNVIVIQGSVHAVGNSTEVITIGGNGGPNV